jgi:BASS family bile acid:Na+ symporter
MLNRVSSFFSSYLFVVTLALLAGVFLFEPAREYLAPYTTYFLGAIFFFTALKIDMRKVLRQFQEPKTIALIIFLMLFAFPAVVYYATRALDPELALPFLILASMPIGMTAPLLVELSGGRQSLALVLAVISSLLAPFTVPLVIKLFAGAVVSVSYLDMLETLGKVIFIPFALAWIIRPLTHEFIARHGKTLTALSTTLLGLLIAGVVSKQALVLRESFFESRTLIYLGALAVLFIFFHIAGYVVVWWRDHRDRVTITISLSYMNFTLAVYLVDTYFDEPSVLLPVVLSVIPWTLFLVPFQKIAAKIAGRGGAVPAIR